VKKFLEDMRLQRKIAIEESRKLHSPDNTLVHFLPTPAHLRALSALVNIENIKEVNDEETIICNMTKVEVALVEMAMIIEKFKESYDGNRESRSTSI